MTLSKRGSTFTLCAIMVFFFMGKGLGYSGTPSGSMLPKDLVIEDIFRPGLGSPVGGVLLVQGKVVIMHADKLRGYWAKKDLPLFKDDIIVTLEKGRIRFSLKDESVMTLASKTELVINRSVYDTKKKSRFSFLRMTLGKIRFRVKRFIDLRRSEFKVRTPTSVVGVRGSDFIIRAAPEVTEVTALEETKLEVVSSAFPEAAPMLVTDFERTTVEEGALPTEVEMVAPDEIEQMKKEFTVTPEPVEPEAKVEVEEKKEEEKKEEEPAEKEPEEGVLVSEEELVEPEEVATPEEMEVILEPDIFVEMEMITQMDYLVEIVETTLETVSEMTIITELPDFPGTPQ